MSACLRALVIGTVVALAASVSAEPRNVFVMPVDGQVDAATRERLNTAVQKFAHSLGGTDTTASATFAETASMVGCDPKASACADTVLATLQADEIVWGTVTVAPDGKITLVVHRATKGEAANDRVVTIPPNATPEATNIAVAGGAAASSGAATASSGGTTASSGGTTASGGATAAAASGGATEVGAVSNGSTGTAPPPGSTQDLGWSRQKKIGVGLAIGGGAALVIGFALWASESSVQGQINSSPDNTLQQINSINSLVGTANGYAWTGNLMVLVGLAAGAVGGYYLWMDHQAHLSTVAAAPVDHGTGATLLIGGRW